MTQINGRGQFPVEESVPSTKDDRNGTKTRTSKNQGFEIRQIVSKNDAGYVDGSGGAPLPLLSDTKIPGPVALTRNNSIAGQPRTKPRADGPPVKKKSRPLSRSNQNPFFEETNPPQTARKNRKEENSPENSWGSSTPPPPIFTQGSSSSSFVQRGQQATPLSPRAKNKNKFSTFQKKNHNKNRQSNRSKYTTSGSEGDSDVHGDDSDGDFQRYGAPLDPTQSNQLSAHMSALRVKNEGSHDTRNALFLHTSDFTQKCDSLETDDVLSSSNLSSFDEYDKGETALSSQGSFNGVIETGQDGRGRDEERGGCDSDSTYVENHQELEEDNDDFIGRLSNRRGSEYFQEEDYDPGAWMNGDDGGEDEEDANKHENSRSANNRNVDNEDSDSLGVLFSQRNDNDRGPTHERNCNSTTTLVLSQCSDNPFYTDRCPSFLQQEADVLKPTLSRAPASAADYFLSTVDEPENVPPPMLGFRPQASASFAEIHNNEQISSSSSSNNRPSSSNSGLLNPIAIDPSSSRTKNSFDMAASSSLSSSGGWLKGGWINGNGAPLHAPRRGSQTGGFGSLNFDDSTDDILSNENQLSQQSTSSSTGRNFNSQRSSQNSTEFDNGFAMSTPLDNHGDFNEYSLTTPRASDLQDLPTNGVQLTRYNSGPVYNGPTRIFIQNGEIPSRKTVEFQELFELGRGQFGSVSCCRKRTDGINYAIKRQVLDRMSAAARAGAKREVYALSALPDCPNLVRYYDAWYEDNETLLFIQTEYLPGGTLLCLAEKHVLTEEGARRAIRDIARALAYMHDKGIGHLDVKPENILAVGDGGFKLGDLGHATLLDQNMSPEEGDRSYLLECMPDDFYRDVKLDALPPGAEEEGISEIRTTGVTSSMFKNKRPTSRGSPEMFFFGDGNDMNDSTSPKVNEHGLYPFPPLPTPTNAAITTHQRKIHHSDGGGAVSSSSGGLNQNHFLHPLSNSSYNNDMMESSHNTSSSSLQFYSDGKQNSSFHHHPYNHNNNRSLLSSSGSSTPTSTGAPPPSQGIDGENDDDAVAAVSLISPPAFAFGSNRTLEEQLSGNSSDLGLSISSPNYEDETSIGSPILSHQGSSQMESMVSLPTPIKPRHHFSSSQQSHTSSPQNGVFISKGPNKNGTAPWQSPDINFKKELSNQNQSSSLLNIKKNNKDDSALNQNKKMNHHRRLLTENNHDSFEESDPKKIALKNRAVYLAASDVFALGLGFYEVARMAERPEGYRVPTNGKEYSDLRQGQAPPMVLSAMSPAFSKSFEESVLDVIKPRSYRNRPTATDVLLMFSDPLIEQRFNSASTSSSLTSLATHMPPPPPRSESPRNFSSASEEVTYLRKRVLELENALANQSQTQKTMKM